MKDSTIVYLTCATVIVCGIGLLIFDKFIGVCG